MQASGLSLRLCEKMNRNITLPLLVLYIDLRPGQTCHSKDAEVAYSIGVGELGWQYGTGLKSHSTVIDWCTGREWPVNCMTVISAWWRSNMPFQRLSGRLNYYITLWRQELSQFGDQKSWRNDAVEKTAPSRELGPRASSWAAPWRTGKKRLWPIRVGVNMLQFCSVSNSLSHTNLSNKVRGIFF